MKREREKCYFVSFNSGVKEVKVEDDRKCELGENKLITYLVKKYT